MNKSGKDSKFNELGLKYCNESSPLYNGLGT